MNYKHTNKMIDEDALVSLIETNPPNWLHAIEFANRHREMSLRNSSSLHWRHNERSGVLNHQPHDCLFNCFFRRRSKKTPKLRVTGLCPGNSSMTGEFPHKGPVTRKILQFDDVIMSSEIFFVQELVAQQFRNYSQITPMALQCSV